MNVNLFFPGSTNDSYIWNNSNVLPVVKDIYERGHTGFFLLGKNTFGNIKTFL